MRQIHRKTCLVPRSDEFQFQGQRSKVKITRDKNDIFGPFGGLCAVYAGKTSSPLVKIFTSTLLGRPFVKGYQSTRHTVISSHGHVVTRSTRHTYTRLITQSIRHKRAHNKTRYRASTSMHSLTFRVRVATPPQYGMDEMERRTQQGRRFYA